MAETLLEWIGRWLGKSALRLPKALHTLELNELRRRRPKVVPIKEWFELCGAVQGKGRDLGIGARFIKEWN